MKCCYYYLCCVFLFGITRRVNSSDEFEKRVEGDTKKSITDALTQIAKILQNNKQHSSLYETVAALEASVKMSLDRNLHLEKRVKEMEKKIFSLNEKIETSTVYQTKMEALEVVTNSLLADFEEKLSALAGEIVRLKRTHQPPKMVKKIPNVPMTFALSGNKIQEERKEDADEVEEQMEICPLVSGDPQNVSNCLFSSEGRHFNWTAAKEFCEGRKGVLADQSDIQLIKAGGWIKENNNRFWISEISMKELLQYKKQFLEENFKYLSDGSNGNEISVKNVKFLDVEKENDSNHVSILALEDTIPINTTDNVSGVINIHNLPNSEEIDVMSDRTVYKLNNDQDEKNFPPTHDNHHIIKRSKEPIDSLSIPQDAVSLNELLLLQSPQKLLKLEEAQEEKQVLREEMEQEEKQVLREKDIHLADSGTSGLLPFLTGHSNSRRFRNVFHPDKVEEKTKCPALTCNEDSAKCTLSLRLCSELNSFFCSRNV